MAKIKSASVRIDLDLAKKIIEMAEKENISRTLASRRIMKMLNEVEFKIKKHNKQDVIF